MSARLAMAAKSCLRDAQCLLGAGLATGVRILDRDEDLANGVHVMLRAVDAPSS